MAGKYGPNKLRGLLTEAELRRLYYDDKLSQWQIAERFGVTQGAIAWRMRRWGISARGHDDALILLGKQGRFTGEKNPRWRGGRHMAGGYWRLRLPEHPKADNRGYVREHVYVWEQANGVSLPKGWHVHHKNGDKTDNRPENLEAMTHSRHRDVLPEMLRRIAALEAENARLRDELDRALPQREQTRRR